MKRNYPLLLVLILSVYLTQLSAQICQNDTTFTDVIFLVDNSGSITDAEYNELEDIIMATLGRLEVSCPDSRRGIVHYGGFEGSETIIEYPLSGSGSILNVNRQFCTTRIASNPNVCTGGNGGDDLNNAIGDIMFFLGDGSLQLDTANDLKLVILTDAFNTGPICNGPACSVILPTTNIDRLKADYDADVTVVGISQQASADVLGIYASPGGTYTDTDLNATYCGTSFDGCDLPRKYVPIEFNTDPDSAAAWIVPLIECETTIIEAAIVDAGSDQTICGDRGEAAFLRATPLAGTAPFTYEWSNGLGSGASKVVTPAVTTTYTVTMTDMNNCVVTDDITITALTCGPDCEDDTVFTDIILMIDNSGSITEAEFTAFENIIVTSLGGLRNSCPLSRRAVMHYGGAFGRETFVEYALGESPMINGIMRQFCATRNSSGNCNDGGDDLNFAMGELIGFIEDGSIARNPNNNLSLIVLTDAFNIDDCATNPNCSVSLPTTNVDTLKSRYGASVTVVGISDQARPEALAITASPGGDFNAVTLLADCQNSFDGCQLPRKYVPIEFSTPAQQVSNALNDCVDCQAIIKPKVIADAGPDQLICENLGESASITATGAVGVEPYTFQWSGGLGTNATITVMPSITTTYSVTITDANTCMDVDSVTVNAIECEDCNAEAGTPLPPLETCFENGRAFVTGEPNIGVIRPAGYEVVYFLTNSDLVILDFVIGERTFTIREPGTYRVHTLIAETSNRNSEDFFDLSVIVKGESGLFIITNCIIDHGVCADFDYPGRVHIILPEDDMRCMELENSITLCSDGIDNDDDGLVDCGDPDCIPLMNCVENNLLACNDLFDNDKDGLVDCFDPDCFAFRRCFEKGDLCNDGIDNDGDGLIDCLDDSCGASAQCIENNAFTCTDGIDNDNDGLTDCQEAVCQKFIVCAEANIAACSDGIDNDADGLIDCADANCKEVLSEVCTPVENTTALCSDGIDNDADGLLDCDDPDCGVTQFDNGNRLENLVTTTSASCPSNTNGTIVFTVPASLSSYEYSIDGGENFSVDSIFSGITPGNYTVALRAAGACNIVGRAVTVSGEMCPEVCNNGIDDDGDGLADCDDSDCGINRSVAAIIADPACPRRGNGVIRLFYTNATGGVSGLEYSIDGGTNYQTQPIFRNLDGGRYNIRVRSADGCEATEVVTLADPSCPEVCNNGIDDDGDGQVDCADGDCLIAFTVQDVSIVAPSCPALDDGMITINLPGFTYRLGDTGDFQEGNIFTSVTPGSYILFVRNENGCSANVTVIIEDISCIEVCDNGIDDDGDGLTDCDDDDCSEGLVLETELTAATCPDLNDGIITISMSVEGLEYAINSGDFSTTTVYENLTPGTYSVSARNTNGCIIMRSVILGAPPSCEEICDNGIDDDGDGQIDCEDGDCNTIAPVEELITEVTCPDLNDGVIRVRNVVAGLEYSIDDGAYSSNSVFEGLVAGNYIINARNATGCIVSKSVIVTGPAECAEICDNGIDDDGDGMVDCEDSDCAGSISITETASAPICPMTDNGLIQVNRLDTGFFYAIDDGEFMEDTIFTGLVPGVYTINVRNSNGCIATKSVEVPSSPVCVEICDNGIDDDGDGLTDCDDDDCSGGLVIETQLTAATCPDLNDGIITISMPGEGLEYAINGGDFSSSTVFDSLTPGTYSVSVRNINGCMMRRSIILGAPPSCSEICDNGIDDDGDGLVDCEDGDCSIVSPIEELITDVTCPGLDNGVISIINDITALEYSINDSPFDTTSVFENLVAGSYTVNARNAIGCIVSKTVIVVGLTQCGEICDNSIDDDGDGLIDCDDPDCNGSLIIVESTFSPTCPMTDNGEIQVDRLGDGFLYSIDNGEFTEDTIFTGLIVGSYTINVRNLNGCVTSKNVEVTGASTCTEICDNNIDDDGDGLTDCDDPDCGISILIDERVTPTVCPANNNGTIELINDTLGLEFSIDDVIFTNATLFENLSPGEYRITARNGNGCLASKMIVVPGVEVCVEICDNDIDDDGDGLTDCEDDDCQVDESFTFNVMGECPGLANGAIEVVPATTDEYRFSLSGSAFQTDPEFAGLGQGSYDITVANIAGCDTILTVVVPEDTCTSAAAALIPVTMNLKVMLEGPYQPDITEMTTFLNQGGYLPGQKPSTFFGAQTPAGHPFNQAPWFHEGTEGENTLVYHPDVVDWILVSLRTDFDKTSELCRTAALLHKDGSIEFVQEMVLPEGSIDDAYYIVIEHRSHLPVMSAVPVPLVGGALGYDFTQTDSYKGIFGVGQKQVSDGSYTMVSGNGELVAEISSDIDINARDLTSWLEMNGGNSSYYVQDYDMNGDINIKDRILWEQNNGLFSTISTKR